MTGIPFPEYALVKLTRTGIDLDVYRTQWVGSSATGLLADTLTMAIELDHIYALFEADLSEDAVDTDDMVAVEDLFQLPGLGSIFGLALDVSIYLAWLEDDERDRNVDTEFPRSAGALLRAIAARQFEWLTETRDAFKPVLEQIQAKTMQVQP